VVLMVLFKTNSSVGPQNATVSVDAGIEARTIETLASL